MPPYPSKRSGTHGRVLLGCSAALLVSAVARVVMAEEPSDAAPAETEAPSQPPTQLTPMAQEFLSAARARFQTEQDNKRQRAYQAQRQQAQRLALQMSRERLRERQVKEAAAARQVRDVRERQLKTAYQKALALYQHGQYDEAIRLAQQMALVDPDHPLVKSAERLMARAELKQFERRLQTQAELPPGARGARVSELEDLLTHKRVEIETTIKHAKAAAEEERYDTATKLLAAVLVQDPMHREAQQLLERVHLQQLKEEHRRVARQVEQDEQQMANEVMKAQLLPADQPGSLSAHQRLIRPSPDALNAKLQQPISFEFKDVALGDVLDFIADAGNVSLIPSPQLDLNQKRVSLKVTELPLEQALKYLAKSLSLAYRFEHDTILLATSEEFLKEPMETRIFFLRNGLGPFALETAAVEPNPALAMDSIKQLITETVPQPSGSTLVVDERSGALIATNTKNHLALIERLLSQLDVTPVQVLIEARFVELTMTELEQQAFESVLNAAAALSKKTAGDGTQGVGNQLSSGGGLKFPALARESEGLNLTLQGILSGTQFESVLHVLEESQKSKTLSAPRVTTLNNQTADIKVVEEFRFPTRYEVSLVQFDTNGDGDFDDAGETEFVNVPQDVQQRDVGILLHVTPSVGKDLNAITLILAPEVSQFSQFRDLGGGVTVPEFTSSQLTTSVVIGDGQTVVLGGLMKDTTATRSTSVPVLGDLPLVGSFFRQTRETSTRKNLLIFITAHLLAPRGQTT